MRLAGLGTGMAKGFPLDLWVEDHLLSDQIIYFTASLSWKQVGLLGHEQWKLFQNVGFRSQDRRFWITLP